MRLPINIDALQLARLYAIDSINYTHDYHGFDGENKDNAKKIERIMVGKLCEMWLAQYCKLNRIDYKPDESTPQETDSGDLFVHGWNVDCKGTIHPGFAGQISKNHDSKNNTIDYYAFFRTDRFMSFIEPLGMIHKSKVHASSRKICEGEEIPGTGIKQRFDYSYIVDIKKLVPLDAAIQKLASQPRR